MEENPTVTGEFTGRYTIERELGRGGAAVVYLARDNRQERHVALKVLHKELAQAIGAQRFLREIKHSSALQHPHLLTILDSGESRGTLYYVMPYMADGSLRTRIAKEKQLPIDDALRITKDVGEALAYAHAKGIVHRDIKPDNVLFSGDHACLADFGIARAVDSVAADTLTSTGLVVGTPAYMSPEQASGEKTVDARSDQYSLGCLLYEMITGLPPFIGATQQSVISQRFTQPPPSMRVHRPNVPDHVERAVKRALAVIPADRFPSVKEFVEALHDPSARLEPVSPHSIRRRWFAVGAVAAIVTLAVIAAKPGADWMRGAFGPQLDTTNFVVLPFLSEDGPEMGKRVADGLHSALREWEGLGLEGDVEVRDVVADAGGQVTSLSEALGIARKLGAGRLVWGTVRSEGERARVVAHLYDVDRSAKLVERNDAIPSDALGDSAFREIGNGLLALAAAPDAFDPGYAGTKSYPALQSYRRGISALGDFKLEIARDELRRAVSLDPQYGVAHLELARLESWLQQSDNAAWQPSAMKAVSFREELRPSDAMRAAALYAYAQADYPTACRHYEALIAADTLDARAWYGLGACLHADSTVVPDQRSPTGYRFRSSWHAAGVAFLRALEIEPRMHAIPQFRRLRQLFATEPTRIRPGESSGPSPGNFAAYPQLVGDTLAFFPIPASEFSTRRGIEHETARQSQALVRNQRIARQLTATWAAAYPTSHDAHLAHASVLEVSADLEGALASLARARRLSAPDIDQLTAAETEARVRLKNGDFETARLVADSALQRFGRNIAVENWESIARLAGLTGRAGKLGEALAHYWEKFANVEDIDPSVAKGGGELLAHAALGECGGRITALTQQLDASIRSRVRPHRHPEVREKVVNASATYLMPCTRGRSMASVNPGTPMITRAQRALSTGDVGAVRSTLALIAENRSQSRPGDVSVNLIARESWLRLALGDTASAVALMDGTLDALPVISAAVLTHPLENALLVSLMVDRADVAAGLRDTRTARKWAAAVSALWAGADPALRPTVDRMRKLAGVR